MKQNLSQRHREGVAFRKTREGPLQRSGVLHYKSRPPLLQWSGALFLGRLFQIRNMCLVLLYMLLKIFSLGNVSSLNISILTPQSDDRALIVHLLRIIRCPPSSDRCHLIYSELPHLWRSEDNSFSVTHIGPHENIRGGLSRQMHFIQYPFQIPSPKLPLHHCRPGRSQRERIRI